MAFGSEEAAKKRKSRDSGVVSRSSESSGLGEPSSVPQHSEGSSFDQDSQVEEVMVSSVEFSLICPYSLKRMSIPVRSLSCNHLQCCDLHSWLVMMTKAKSLRDPSTFCPHCKKRVAGSSLEVDRWMLDLLTNAMPSDTRLVSLLPNGEAVSGDQERKQRRPVEVFEIEATQRASQCAFDVEEEEEEAQLPSPPLLPARLVSSVKRERLEEEEEEEEEAKLPPLTSPEPLGAPPAVPLLPSAPDEAETDVYVDFSHGGTSEVRVLRALPTSYRNLWSVFCPQCSKRWTTSRATAYNGVAEPEQCEWCGWTVQCRWEECVLARVILPSGERGETVSLELRQDGTLLLRGMDEACEYLHRAGFWRCCFTLLDPNSPLPSTPPALESLLVDSSGERRKIPKQFLLNGVWATSIPLARVDLDFVEACGQRLANGEGLSVFQEFGTAGWSAVPPLFRIPAKRRRMEESGRLSSASFPSSYPSGALSVPPSQERPSQTPRPWQGQNGRLDSFFQRRRTPPASSSPPVASNIPPTSVFFSYTP